MHNPLKGMTENLYLHCPQRAKGWEAVGTQENLCTHILKILMGQMGA